MLDVYVAALRRGPEGVIQNIMYITYNNKAVVKPQQGSCLTTMSCASNPNIYYPASIL